MHKPILLTAGFLLLAAPLARAQQTSGTYTMSVGGNAVSVENYTLTSEPNGALRAEAEISAGGGKQKTTTTLSKGRLVSFLAQAGETKLISAAFDGPAVKLQIAGQDERRLTTKATVILENTVMIEAQGVKVVRPGSEQLAEAVSKPIAAEGFLSEEVTFRNGDLSLAGTLTMPKGGAKSYPAALLISGSGSQNRDGHPGVFGLYKLIAEKLSANGVAVLRHDDRGAGKSSMPKTPTTYRDLINDSKAAVEYLRSRKDIDPDRIALIGHSEGGTTATIIASEDSKIAAIALLAGAILTNFDQILFEQTIYQLALERPFNPQDREKYPQIVRWLLTQIEEAKAGKQDSAVTDLREYVRQHLALNQAETYKRIRCPVLILQGERDALVLASHAVAAARALADAGNKQVSVRIFPNLSHSFTPSPLDKSVAAEKKNQISPEAVETIQKLITEVVIGSQESRTSN